MKCFIIARDRVTYARRCHEAMTRAGLEVVIVDHGSTWQPMREWLASLSATMTRVWHDQNAHPRDVWRPGGPIALWTKPDERFLAGDCDVVPDEDCPADWAQHLGWMLDRFPAVRKAGLGLRTDDLPVHYQHADMVRTWEAQYQAVADGGRLNPMRSDNGAVLADIDTTLSMYRRYEPFTLGPAVRLRAPYVARHLPWYEDTLHLDEEQQYYRNHAEHGHWRAPTTYADDYGLRG